MVQLREWRTWSVNVILVQSSHADLLYFDVYTPKAQRTRKFEAGDIPAAKSSILHPDPDSALHLCNM